MKKEVTQLLVQGAQLWEEQKADKLLNTKVHGTGHPIRVLRAVNIIQIYGHTQTAALWTQQQNLGQLVRIVGLHDQGSGHFFKRAWPKLVGIVGLGTKALGSVTGNVALWDGDGGGEALLKQIMTLQ